MLRKQSIFLILCLLFFSSCTETVIKEKNSIVVHRLNETKDLNPITSRTSSSFEILDNIYQKLMNLDHRSLEIVPLLAESRPQIKLSNDGGMIISYTLKKEATWANGTSVKPQDVIFSMKAIFCPWIESQHLKPYFEFIEDIYPDSLNDRTLHFKCKEVFIRSEYSTGCDFYVIPEYAYDPNFLLRKYSFKELKHNYDVIAENIAIKEFAKQFNATNVENTSEFINGSGPYLLTDHTENQRIVLHKKKNWWGNKYKNQNTFFAANLDKITFQLVSDFAAAKNLVKAQEIDLITLSKPFDFEELQESSAQENYNFELVPINGYSYIGLNLQNPKLKGKHTRQALAHLVDFDKIHDLIHKGYAQRISGPILPGRDKFYFDTYYEFNPNIALRLLKKDGWEDTDNDGVLDKIIEGEKTDLELEFVYNARNESRKNTLTILKEDAEKIGIKIDIVPKDWNVLSDNLTQHQFELYYGSWMLDLGPEDPAQLFSTASSNGGSNYTAFGNKKTDSLITKIQTTLNENERALLWQEFNQILYEEVPYIFLFSPKRFLVVHKRFDNVTISPVMPGYWEAGFIEKPQD